MSSTRVRSLVTALFGIVAGVGISIAVGAQADGVDAPIRTLPYAGYVDFDGQPVNASAVHFNFALFACPNPGNGIGQCPNLWVARGTWNAAQSDWTQAWPTGASDFVALPIFAGRFTVELGASTQSALPDAVFASGYDTLYLGMRIEGRTLGTLQKIVPATRAIVANEADRLRVRTDVTFDDGVTGGSATVAAEDGLVVSYTKPGMTPADPLFSVGAGATPSFVVSGAGATVNGTLAAPGGVVFGDGIDKRHGTLEAAGMVRSEGGQGTGDQVTMLSITLDLTGMDGRWMHVYGGTALSENSNTANTAIVRLVIDNNAGTKSTIAAQRQGDAVHGGFSGEEIAAMATQGYFQITSAYAVANVTLQLIGGIDTGAFSWGDQPSYPTFDGDKAGGTLGYAIF